MSAVTNVSNELVWQITRNQNSYLVRRNTGGGSQFSRDPLNLVNKHSFKAIGVQATENGGVAVTTKKAANPNKPAQNQVTVNYGPNAGNRKIYKGVASKTAQNGYRADLREEAVARVSAVRRSQKAKKETTPRKPRGSKAVQAAEKAE
ncbi:unnamed protein product [Penicillium manginii]